MSTFVAVAVFEGSGWLGWSLELLIRTTLVLLIAHALAALLGPRRAEAVRGVWIFAFVGVLLLPLAMGIVPRWQIAVLAPQPASSIQNEAPTADSPAIATDAATPRASNVVIGAAPDGSALAAQGDRNRAALSSAGAIAGIARMLVGGWLGVAAFAVLGVLGGLALIEFRVRRAINVRDPGWQQQLARLRALLHIRRPVRLVASPVVQVPMTGGLIRPSIFLPPAALTWPPETLRLVLLHELIHIQRADWLIDLLGRLARAMFWFHPLMWSAVYKWRLACERSCDARVIAGGTRPSSYAQLLLGLADAARHSDLTPAMASKQHLEERLMAILQPASPARTGFAELSLLFGLFGIGVAGVLAVDPVRQDAAAVQEKRRVWVNPDHAARSSNVTIDNTGQQDGQTVMQHRMPDGLDLLLRTNGKVEFEPESGALQHMGDDATLTLETRLDGVEFRLVVTPGEFGQADYAFGVNGRSREFDGAAREWMHEALAFAAPLRQISEIRCQVGTLRGSIGQIHGQVGSLRGAIGEIHGQVGTLRGQIGQIRGEEGNIRGQIGQIHGEVGTLRGKIGALEGKVSALRARAGADAERELAAMNVEQTRADLREKIAAINEGPRVAQLEQKIAEMKVAPRVAALEEKIAAIGADGRIAELEQRIGQINAAERIAAFEEQIAALNADQRIAALQAELAPRETALRERIRSGAARYSVSGAALDADEAVTLPADVDADRPAAADEWDEYVANFAREHDFGPQQLKRAQSILTECKRSRDWIRTRFADRLESAEGQRAAALQQELDEQVQRIFDRMLTANLERLVRD